MTTRLDYNALCEGAAKALKSATGGNPTGWVDVRIKAKVVDLDTVLLSEVIVSTSER